MEQINIRPDAEIALNCEKIMLKFIRRVFNKPKLKPKIIYKEKKRITETKTRTFKDIEYKKVDFKENNDHYYLLKKGNSTIAFSKEARTILKQSPEIVRAVEHLLFQAKVPFIESAKYRIKLSILDPQQNSGRNNLGTYKLTYLNKETNQIKDYFLKLGKKLDIGNYPSYKEFESQKILEAEGFNIIKPQFAIWGENTSSAFSKFNNIIVYDFTNLTNFQFAINNKLLSKPEIRAIKRNLSKARYFAETKLEITDISTKRNIFFERLSNGEIKLYFTDSAKIWRGKD